MKASILRIVIAAALLSTLNLRPATALAQGAAFPCAGRLLEGGRPAQGDCDLRFLIHDSTNHPGTAVAWRGRNPLSNAHGIDLLLFHFRWENPRPGVPIEGITFRSRLTRCAPFLLAITTE